MMRNPISDSREKIIRKMLIKGLVKESLSMDEDGKNDIRKAKTLPYQTVKKEKVGPYTLVLSKNTEVPPKQYSDGSVGLEYGEYIIYGGPGVIWNTRVGGPPWTSTWRISKEHAEKEYWQIIRDVDNRLLPGISNADPTNSGQYATWLARMVLNGSIRMPEDVEKLEEDLFSYHEKKHRGVIPSEFRDINQFGTYGEFFALLDKYQEKISGKEQLKLALRKGKTVYQSENYTVIEVKSWQLAKSLATGTGWCVRGTDMAKHYLKDPENYPLYFFYRGEEPYALLTNHPDEQQFMDPHNDPIESFESDELRKILHDGGLGVDGSSSWIFCGDCGRESWGENYDLAGYIDSKRQGLESGARELNLAWTGPALIAEIPSPLKGQPVIASPKMLESKIVIGPTDVLTKIPGVRLPSIQKFAEKAGFGAMDYIRPLLKVNACDVCLQPDDDENVVGKVLSALYVLGFCEDYPACGHELLSMGAPGCPPTYDQEQVGMRCVCGAFVPLGNRHSLCNTCLKAEMHGEGDNYDYDHWQDEESYDIYGDPRPDYEDYDYDDQTPLKYLLDRLQYFIRMWDTPGYYHRGEDRKPHTLSALPSWDEFNDLMIYGIGPCEELPPSKNIEGVIRVLTAYWKRGYFDVQDYRNTMLPNFKLLYEIAETIHRERDES